MKIKGEKHFLEKKTNTPEEFIEDLCERINNVYRTVMEEDDKMHQLLYLIGFLTALKGRLNRVCENF